MNHIRDVRDLLGMRSRAAYAVVAFYAFACTVSALSTLEGTSHTWPILLAILICVSGAFSLLAAPGDPLPLTPTLALVAVGPVSCALVYSVIPTPVTSTLQTWPLGASIAIYTFMCVRGRTWFAWIGLTLMLGVTILWAAANQNLAYGMSLATINVAPLLMATFFAFTIRPLGRSIFQLREQSTLRVAAAAAASAALDERDAQLRRLDEQARPLLGRIADGPELDQSELLVCELLEADLRDSLRARGLLTARLARAARSARSRGVQVVMLDDRGDVELDPHVRTALADSAADRLDSISTGSATVRLLPPGRPLLATMLVDAGNTYRVEYGHDGRPA